MIYSVDDHHVFVIKLDIIQQLRLLRLLVTTLIGQRSHFREDKFIFCDYSLNINSSNTTNKL